MLLILSAEPLRALPSYYRYVSADCRLKCTERPEGTSTGKGSLIFFKN
jgi:hypothetical protein